MAEIKAQLFQILTTSTRFILRRCDIFYLVKTVESVSYRVEIYVSLEIDVNLMLQLVPG